MPNSLEHCFGCAFSALTPGDTETIRRENYLVVEGIFADGNPGRQRDLKQFEHSIRQDGFEEARIVAAGACRVRHLTGECEY